MFNKSNKSVAMCRDKLHSTLTVEHAMGRQLDVQRNIHQSGLLVRDSQLIQEKWLLNCCLCYPCGFCSVHTEMRRQSGFEPSMKTKNSCLRHRTWT